MVPRRRTREPGCYPRAAVLVLGVLSQAAPRYTGNPALDGRGLGFLFTTVSCLFTPTIRQLPVYAPVPFLIWAATRFGPIGASSALSLIALLSMVHVGVGKGLFRKPRTTKVLLRALFLAVDVGTRAVLAISSKNGAPLRRRLRETQKKTERKLRPALATWRLNS